MTDLPCARIRAAAPGQKRRHERSIARTRSSQPAIRFQTSRDGAGSLVIVDNMDGKFTITPSAANDEPARMAQPRAARKLRDLAKAGHLAQPEAHLVPTGAVLVHHLQIADSTRLKSPTHFINRTAGR